MYSLLWLEWNCNQVVETDLLEISFLGQLRRLYGNGFPRKNNACPKWFPLMLEKIFMIFQKSKFPIFRTSHYVFGWKIFLPQIVAMHR